MPQFDTYSFCSQIFWVILCFSFVYLIFTFYVLPSIAANFKTRKAIMLVANTGSSSLFFSSLSGTLVTARDILLHFQKFYPLSTQNLLVQQPEVGTGRNECFFNASVSLPAHFCSTGTSTMFFITWLRAIQV